MKRVNNLVQEINNIVQHRQECQTMEYDVHLFLFVKLRIVLRKHRQKLQHGTSCQKRFLENKKVFNYGCYK